MATKLEKENVCIVAMNLIDDCGFWEFKDKDAEKLLTYIAGVKDMANAIMKAIEDLGGK